MRYLKLYEQFDFEDFSDEELFGVNRGPYDDILKYGNDGPDFKAGDRVICIKSYDDNPNIKNEIGTVVEYHRTGYAITGHLNLYLVCFDNDIEGNPKNREVPDFHGWNIPAKCLKKLNRN